MKESDSAFRTPHSALLDIDRVLEVLRAAPEGISAGDISEELNLGRTAQKELSKLLNRLQGTGLLRRNGQEFRLSPSGRVLVGTLRQRRRKTISFIPDDQPERSRGRIRIAPEDTGGAFDGDRVIVSLARQSVDGVRDGKVEMILRRGQLRIVGRLRRGFRDAWVESLDDKFPFDIDLSAEDGKDLDEGWIVVVEVTGYPTAREKPAGRILERLG